MSLTSLFTIYEAAIPYEAASPFKAVSPQDMIQSNEAVLLQISN